MKLTKEQEEELKKKIEINENQTEFVCQECNAHLIGMKGVRKHHDENNHYEYKIPGQDGTLGFI